MRWTLTVPTSMPTPLWPRSSALGPSWTSAAGQGPSPAPRPTWVEVIAIDPAAASLHVARCKSAADQGRWLNADATSLLPLRSIW